MAQPSSRIITLTISYADGSVYWVEHFNDIASADEWLAEEKTRPYWRTEFTSTIVDTTPPDPQAPA